jgi:PPP family 3-phenylpropionic acid transporter
MYDRRKKMKKLLSLDIKYALSQILYFGSFCALMGYASVYLLDQGVSNSIIGLVLASISIISVFTQPAIASFADNHQNIELRKIINLAMIIVVALSIILYLVKSSTIVILCLFVGIVTLMMTIQPLINSLAFLFEKYGIEVNYGVARGFGSAAYALVSFVLGYLVEDFGTSIIPLVYIIFNVLFIFVVQTYVIPKNLQKEVVQENKEEVQEESQLSFIEFCKTYKKFTVFVLGTVVVFFTHQLINNFFIQIIKPIGGTESQMGTAVFIAAILELPAMSAFNAFRDKLSCSKLLVFSSIIFAIKHIITWLAPNIMWIYIAQVCQIGAYAIYLPASVYYVNQIIKKEDSIKGQSMITMGMTAGGIFANLAGGMLLDTIGVSSVLLLGSILSVIGVIVVMFSVEKA